MSLRLRAWRAEQAHPDSHRQSIVLYGPGDVCVIARLSVVELLQKEEEDARKLYDEFVESFGDEPEQKASKRSFTHGGVIQPGSSASSAGTSLACLHAMHSPSWVYITPRGSPSALLMSVCGKSCSPCRPGAEEGQQICSIFPAAKPCSRHKCPDKSPHRSCCGGSSHQLETWRGEQAQRQPCACYASLDTSEPCLQAAAKT